MHLRPTTATDLPRCVTITDTAFKNNELTNFLAPNRTKYPLSWRQRALNLQRCKYYQPGLWSFVCVADADDDFADAGEILGYARWARCTSTEDATADPWAPRRLSLLEHAESWLHWAEFKWGQTLRTNPAVSWAQEAAFARSIVVSTGLAPIRAATHWYLDIIAVAPEYQRRGVARRLVNWGLESAKTESEARAVVGKQPVPVALVATAPGLPLYKSLGFRVVGWGDDSFMGFTAEGGSYMVWDPTGYWIEDVEHEQQIKRGVVEVVYTTRDKK